MTRTINKAGDENYFHQQLLKYGPIFKITTLGEIIKLFFFVCLFFVFFSSLPSPSLVGVQKAWVREGGDKWKSSGGGWLFRAIGPTFQHSKTFDSLVAQQKNASNQLLISQRILNQLLNQGMISQ